jgi:dTDP-glucose pyrophosphorylase
VGKKSNNWRKSLVSADSSIKEAIRALDDGSLRFVMIVDSKFKLIGTVTDGDIRRGLLRDLTLTDSIESIINVNPISTDVDTNTSVVEKLMLENSIQQIPILSESGIVVGVHIWEELGYLLPKDNLMVIMAGGKGTRLQPLTNDIPKPLLMVSGVPIIEHIIIRAKQNGFRKFLIAINHLGNLVENYLGDGSKLGVSVRYIREETELGTAGALSLIDPLPTLPVVVTNGDVLTGINYSEILEFHNENESSGTMAVRIQESQNLYGVVETDGFEIIEYKEKPITKSLINAGVYVLNPDTLSLIPKSQKYHMPELFETLRLKLGEKTTAYLVHENWIDIGRPEDYLRANQ